jgi:uridine kinase
MEREKLLAKLLNEIAVRKAVGRPLLVGIDGRCASGKTALAGELAAALAIQSPSMEVLRLSVDGFHNARERRYRQGEFSANGYYEDAYDYRTLIDCLLHPLSGSEFPVLCRQVSLDLRADLPDAAPPIATGANAVLLFDGLFLFRSSINEYWDLRILLNVSSDESISRAVARDTGVIGTAEIVRKKYALRYEPAWRIYVEAENPARKADWIIDNEDIRNPRVAKPEGWDNCRD